MTLTSGTGRMAGLCTRPGKTGRKLSDRISKDLKKRGMKFVGTVIIYAYLQAVGVINSHEEGCFRNFPS